VFFVVEDESDIYALVQSCDNSDHDKDSYLSSIGQKNFNTEDPMLNPCCNAVPVESSGHQVLVIEDDASIVEQLKREDLKVGVTVVIPCDEYWPSTFLS